MEEKELEFLNFLINQKKILSNENAKQCVEEFKQFQQTRNNTNDSPLITVPKKTPAATTEKNILPLPKFPSEDHTLFVQNSAASNLSLTETLMDNIFKEGNTHSLKLPQEFSQRYAILETLGAGGMGIVERALDYLLGREVAVKTIRIESSETPELTEAQQIMLWRLSQEASITSILEHPNIVPLYDLQQKNNGEIYFTMRIIEGETLTQLLQKMQKKETTHDKEKIFSVFSKVCDAVAYAHSKEIIHRDLKPDNIMIGEFGEVYVMDWGIAKQKQNISNIPHPSFSQPQFQNIFQTSGGIGTPGYMAPEQTKNIEETQPQADIYSLGRILRQCYLLISPMEEFRQILAKSREESKQADIKKFQENSIPKEIQAIIKKATTDDWQKRYSSVHELVQDLNCYRKNLRVSAHHYTPSQVVYKWSSRNRKQIFFTAFIFLFCLITSLLFHQKHLKKLQQETHLNRLNYWSKKFIAGKIEEGERENAIFEISKMPEKAVLLKLLKLLSAGTEYFASHQNRSNQKDQFYEVMVLALGRLENQLAGPFLLKSLQKLSKHYTLSDKPSIADLQFMIALAQALGHSKMEKAAPALGQIRLKMGEHGLFWGNTKLAYLTLLNAESSNLTNSKKANLYLEKGISDYHQKEFKSAIKNLTKAIQLGEAPSWAYTNRGIVYASLEEFQKAIQDHTRAIEINPNFAEAYLNRGVDRLKSGDPDGAIQDHTTAIKINPEYPFAYAARATALSSKEQYQKALKDSNKAIELNPNIASFYVNRGLIHVHLKRWKQAEKDYAQAILFEPNLIQAYQNRGELYLSQKKKEQAIQDFTKALQISPKYFKAYQRRGLAKLQSGDVEGALLDLNTAVKLSPKSIDNYLERSHIRLQLRNPKGAIQDCDKAIELDTNSATAYYYRAAAKLNLRDKEGADKDFLKFLKLTKETKKPQLLSERQRILKRFPHLKDK